MGYSGERHNTPEHPIGNVYVTQCGLTECMKSHERLLHTPAHYSIHFILEGAGVYYIGDKQYHLHAGQGFMLFPNVPCRYTADSDTPWKYIYVSFVGAGCTNLLYYAGISGDKPVFDYELDEEIRIELHSMVYAGRDMRRKGYDVTGYFMLIISHLIFAHRNRVKNNMLSQHCVETAVLYIEDNYSNKVCIQDMADYLGIDRTYLYRLFKQELGVSPTQYLLSYRLERAEVMLKYAEIPICDIAVACGFFDQSHFSRAFSQRYDMSPTKYRKTVSSMSSGSETARTDSQLIPDGI